MKTNKSILKKYASILLCASTLLFSCSKNNENGPDDPAEEETQLILSASATEVEKGDVVTFEVKTEGEVIDADIYIDNDKINGKSYTFEETGNFTALAKKNGYIDSEAIEIAVKAAQVDQVDVYVAGYDKIGSRTVAKYWKNGTPTNLSDGTFSATANAIVVSDGDVYVAGHDYIDTRHIVYWKNGDPVFQSNSSEHPMIYGRSIAVDNGNVYVCGEQKSSTASLPTYWKNGSPIKLADDGNANDIVVENGDVYTVGSGYKHPDKIAKLWKNSSRIMLTNGEQNSLAKAITVANGDVYVAGFELAYYGASASKSTAKYWKNGTPLSLGKNAVPTAITIDNGDVYVAAIAYKNKTGARYWKNDTAIDLSKAQYNATAHDIAVHNGDVYVVGSENNKAVYWKNGKQVTLEANGGAIATSIFIVASATE